MKTTNLIPEDLLCQINDQYLNETIKKYVNIRDNATTAEDIDEMLDMYHKVLDILSYRKIIFPFSITINDTKLSSLYRKGRLPKDLDLFNDDRILHSALYCDTRRMGSNDDYIRYVTICSNASVLKNLDNYNTIMQFTFKEIYEKFVKNDDSVEGIILDPNDSNFMISKEMCEFIVNELPEDIWNGIVEKVKKVDGAIFGTC